MKTSGVQQVEEFMDKLSHPMKNEIEEVRKIILNADERITEHVKWNAPSFCFDGEDRITFHLKGKSGFRLIFHRGAKVKPGVGNEPIFEDSTGLLEWITGDRATVIFTDSDDVAAKKEKLSQVVTQWLRATAL